MVVSMHDGSRSVRSSQVQVDGREERERRSGLFI